MPAAIPMIIPDVMDDDGSESSSTCGQAHHQHLLRRPRPLCSPLQTHHMDAVQNMAHRFGATSRRSRASSSSGVGAGFAPSDNSSIKRSREREGRCADCGMQTHLLEWDPVLRCQVKVPLNISGEVHRGRCLFCYPIYPPHFLHVQQQEELISHHPFKLELQSRSSLHPSCGGQGEAASDYSSSGVGNGANMYSQQQSRRVSQSFATGTPYCRTDDDSELLVPEVQHALCILQNAVDIVDILAAMKSFPVFASVQTIGCERLWVLSWEEENAVAIGRVGGIRVLLDAMNRFPMHTDLQLAATETLQNLVSCSAYNRAEVVELRGVWLLINAMLQHAGSTGIQVAVMTALASLAVDEYGRNSVRRAGGIQAILLVAHYISATTGPIEESVLRAAYDVMHAMDLDPTGRLPPQPRRNPMQQQQPRLPALTIISCEEDYEDEGGCDENMAEYDNEDEDCSCASQLSQCKSLCRN